MKKYLALFVLVSTLSTLCSAQVQLQANKEGVYRIKPDTLGWIDAGITSHPEALRYDLMFFLAISNPGEKILGEKLEKTLKFKPVFKKLVEVKQCFIVYNDSTKNIGYEELTETKEVTSYLLLLSFASLIFMVVSNIFKIKKISVLCFITAYVSAAASLVSAIENFATHAAPLLTVFTPALVFIALLILFTETSKQYWLTSFLFYFFMVTYIVLMYA